MRITRVVNSSRRISADADAAPHQSTCPKSAFNAFHTVCAATLAPVGTFDALKILCSTFGKGDVTAS